MSKSVTETGFDRDAPLRLLRCRRLQVLWLLLPLRLILLQRTSRSFVIVRIVLVCDCCCRWLWVASVVVYLSDLFVVLLDLVADSLCVGGLFWLGRWWCLCVAGFRRRRSVVCPLGLREFGMCFLGSFFGSYSAEVRVVEDPDSFCSV